MVKPGEIRPNFIPGAAKNLNEKEVQKQKLQARSKLSSTDQARIAQQAGFTKKAQIKKKIDIGSSAQAPIPLPDDEVSSENWSSEKLDTAQRNLGLLSTQFDDIQKDITTAAEIAEVLVSGSFLPIESDIQNLEKLAQKQTPKPLPMEEVTTNAERLFNIKLGDELPLSEKFVATHLVVAGEENAVEVEGNQLNTEKKLGGLRRVAQKGGRAVREANDMSGKIGEKLNIQRTFMFKR